MRYEPMLATLVDEPFDKEGWVFEIKFDGFRIMAETERGNVRLWSRNGKDFTERFAPAAAALRKLKRRAVIDGEMVVLDPDGVSSFGKLADYGTLQEGDLAYMAFDLLSLDGKDLRALPLLERKRLLKKILPRSPLIRYSDHVVGRGVGFFALAKKKNLEGIMAKRADSPYASGQRGHDWLKIKTHHEQEFVVGGYTDPRGGRSHFGALVVGYYQDGALRHAGNVGGGFDEKGLAEAFKKMKPLARKTSPFLEDTGLGGEAHWLEPKLVCEVKFAEWTGDGHLRQPVFTGWREDKAARSVVREDAPQGGAKLLPPSKRKKEVFTHLDKVFWKKEGYTKGDVIAYYRDVAPLILPYLKGRPESLNRHPDGIDGENFFQKDVSSLHLPKWVKTTEIASESQGKVITTLVCDNEATLLYMANLGCIEINPWNSRTFRLDKPDWMVVDLDPVGVGFGKVVEAALEVRALLEKLGVKSVPKTSGGRGLHLYVPLGARYTHAQAQDFAQLLAGVLEERRGDLFSTARMPIKRKKKVYFDFLQNKQGATNAAPYSLRPRPGAPVATPLRWAEVKPSLDPLAFTIATARKRFDRVGDLFAPVLGPGADLKDALTRLASDRARW